MSDKRPKAVISDIDEVLCFGAHYPDYRMRAVLHAFYVLEHEIFYFTSRNDYMRNETEFWLNNEVFPPGVLKTRAVDDLRAASFVKQDWLLELKKTHDVVLAIDDLDGNIGMYRRNGVPCLQAFL